MGNGRGNGKGLLKGSGFILGSDDFLEVESNDGSITLWIQLKKKKPWIVHFKMMDFIVGELYIDLNKE